jgi:hypothetical protein
MDVIFPLLVFVKDDRSIFLIETPDRVSYHLEAIDIENEEYAFWDSTGAGACVSVVNGAIGQVQRGEQSMSVSAALRAYSESRGLDISLQGPPLEVWTHIQSYLPRKKSFWNRLFAR